MASGYWDSDPVVYAYDSDRCKTGALASPECGKVPPGGPMTVAARGSVPYECVVDSSYEASDE